VPAGSGPLREGQQVFYFAWRLDTVTGSVEMCTYDPGGWKLPSPPGGIATQSVSCTAAILPY